MTTRFRSDARVVVTGDTGTGALGRLTLEPIPDGEIVTVFEDYGQSHVNVMRDNGQLRTVARASLGLGPEWDGRCRSCSDHIPHTASEHSSGVQSYINIERDTHSAAGGDKCHEGPDGLCLMCGVEMSVCDACHGVGYHREHCPEDIETSKTK